MLEVYLGGAHVIALDLSGILIGRATFLGAQFAEGADFSGATFRGHV